MKITAKTNAHTHTSLSSVYKVNATNTIGLAATVSYCSSRVYSFTVILSSSTSANYITAVGRLIVNDVLEDMHTALTVILPASETLVYVCDVSVTVVYISSWPSILLTAVNNSSQTSS